MKKRPQINISQCRKWLLFQESLLFFSGFILQGRIKNDEGNGDAIGLFNESPDFTYQLMKCFRSLGNTISHHEANKNKTVIVADWDPQGYTGAMEFKSVVVYEYDFGQKLAIDVDL